MLRRCDRYVLREAVGPFALALAGLILFILLNIILSLSDLMVDRGIGMLTLLRLVALKMPSLFVIAVPMSALFATFLGLGRMVHDREIVALESIGIPLRRILVPLILASTLIGIADFAIYNWGVPASERAYQQELRSVIFRQGVPRITANAFFKGADNQFFYIRRYDEEAGTLHDVHIYDTTGRLFPHAESRVTMITADAGRWTGDAWRLESGRVYGFDFEGVLVYSASFEELVIPLEQSVEEILAGSRTPAEMGIGELLRRIGVARETGQRADEYVVEAHLKASLPLATLVFVLLGGGLSLAFNPRSRAAGIVIGLLLVGLFQGALWWTQTLGRRGAMNPALAAWLPDLIFGAFGLLLFLRVDRLASRDLWSRWRGRVSWFACLALLLGFAVDAIEPPIGITSDRLVVSEDGAAIEPTGSVSATYDGTVLHTDSLVVSSPTEDGWRLDATGDVLLEISRETRLEAQHVLSEIIEGVDGVRTERVLAEGFCGASTFVNSAGETHGIRFRVDEGLIAFNDRGAIVSVEARNAELTPCGATLDDQPYTMHARRLLLSPERLLVAFGLTVRVARGCSSLLAAGLRPPARHGVREPALPRVRPELRSRPVHQVEPALLPDGKSLRRVSDRLLLSPRRGRARPARALPTPRKRRPHHRVRSPVGRRVVALHLRARAPARHRPGLGGTRGGGLRTCRREAGALLLRTPRARDRGRGLSIAAVRETTQHPDGSTAEERLPEIILKLDARRVGDLALRPEARAGWIREWKDDCLRLQRLRWSAGIRAIGPSFAFGGLRVAPEAGVDLTYYGNARTGWDRQESLTLDLSGTWRDLKIGWRSALLHGVSPFAFDRLKTEHAVDWCIESGSDVELRFESGVDLLEGVDPIEVAVAWGSRSRGSSQGSLTSRSVGRRTSN